MSAPYCKPVLWICVTMAIMFVLPMAVAMLASECSGMALCMLLFYILNPAYAVILGVVSGMGDRAMWYQPVIAAVAFLLGTWIVFDITEPWFLIYSLVYLIVGWVAMGITRWASYGQLHVKS